MATFYQSDGSVLCVDDGDRTRTTTIPGPRNSGAQLAAIAAFYSGSSYVPPTDVSGQALNTRLAAIESTGKDRPIQRAAPTTGATVASDGSPVLALLHSSTIATLTVTFPSSPRNGQEFGISSKSAVTALTLNGGTTIGAPSALTAGGFATWAFSATDTAWIRAG